MKRIALTFDDGPNTLITPRVLDILEEHNIVASFFLIADSITPNPPRSPAAPTTWAAPSKTIPLPIRI